MKRRTLLAASLVSAATLASRAAMAQAAPLIVSQAAPLTASQAAPLTAQDRADIARIETYLNAIHTLKARFLQVAPDGSTSTGDAWIERPGRLRFQYDPPSPFLLVAGHGLVFFNDSKLGQTNNFPLGSTPLSILLADTVKLSGDITVTGMQRQPGQIQVTTVRTASPGDGSLTLVFADSPLALRQWATIDQQHQETRVSLFNVELGGRFDQDLFTFIDPKFLGRSSTPTQGPPPGTP